MNEYDIDLSLFYNPFIKPNIEMDEIPVDRLWKLLDTSSVIIENSKGKKNYLFDVTNIKEFVSVSSDLIIGEILKIKG